VALFSGIDTVFYQVCNMDRSVAFYEGVLGLELLRREANDWSEFRAGGDQVLALSGELAVAPQAGGATVVLRTDDIEAVQVALAREDVKRGRVEDMGGARMLQFFDPDGNELVAIQPLGD
jgi:catechol 2,3-dioxygenase-like lactoylglutathione lyase family enzyme